METSDRLQYQDKGKAVDPMERGQAPVENEVTIVYLACCMIDADSSQRVEQDESTDLAPIKNMSALQLTTNVSFPHRIAHKRTCNHYRLTGRRKRATTQRPAARLQRYAVSVVRLRRRAR